MSNLSGLKLNYVNFYTFKTIILICLSQTKMYLVGLCTYSGSLEQDILEGVSTNVQFEFKSKSTYFLIIYIHYSEQNMCYLSCKKSQWPWFMASCHHVKHRLWSFFQNNVYFNVL